MAPGQLSRGLLWPGLLVCAGCAAHLRSEAMPVSVSMDTARRLPMYAADEEGVALDWADLMARVEGADVILLGEQHDDAAGHAFEQAIVVDAIARWPETTVSMEMLERDEQGIVDDYLDGIIDADEFARLTFSAGWAGDGSWRAWYLPIVDAAREGGAAVVAANAPRRYVKLVRREGHEGLDRLTAPRRALLACPEAEDHEAYRRRFREAVAPAGEVDHPAVTTTDAPSDDDEATDAESPVDAMFRSQLVWDATMAESIAARLDRGKVIHLVGAFHVEFEGGLVTELRARAPQARILVISMRPAAPGVLLDGDRGRADVVVYTGS